LIGHGFLLSVFEQLKGYLTYHFLDFTENMLHQLLYLIWGINMKRLLIDTNIYLSFYHYSNDDLEELKKLVVLIDQREIKLYVPEQIKLEFQRNRANKIADALKRLRDQNLNFRFPQISKEYQLFSD
jgi:predicted nucleic acid-binding protein